MIDLNSLPLDDKRTYDLISSGYNMGIFQIGEPWLRGILRDIQPECFEDLVVLLALIRPGSLDSDGVKLYIERRREAKRAAP